MWLSLFPRAFLPAKPSQVLLCGIPHGREAAVLIRLCSQACVSAGRRAQHLLLSWEGALPFTVPSVPGPKSSGQTCSACVPCFTAASKRGLAASLLVWKITFSFSSSWKRSHQVQGHGVLNLLCHTLHILPGSKSRVSPFTPVPNTVIAT